MSPLIFDEFNSDKRLEKARALILSALSDHQKNVSKIKKPKAALKKSYAEAIRDFSSKRGGNLWFPYIGSGMGNGSFVELGDGSVKYDFISGIGAHFGHQLPELVMAGMDAAIQNTVMQGNLQQNTGAYRLTRLLIENSVFDHCFLTSSGAMAVENALKIIFQKKFPANRILAFEKCFMGRTLAVSQITDNSKYRDGLPSTVRVDYIPFFDANDPKGSTARACDRLSELLSRYPDQYAVMCFEMIQGEAGYYPGNSNFFKALIRLLKKSNVAVLVDEIQTFGRTEYLFAHQFFGLEKSVDVLTMGKLSQTCATLFKKKFKPRPGLLSQTFTSSSAAIEAACTIVSSLLTDGYLGEKGKIAKVHQKFVDLFEGIRNRTGLISGPYGMGSMVAFTVFDGDAEKTLSFLRQLYENGVIGFVAGKSPMRIRFLVPIGGVTFDDIENVATIIEKTLKSEERTMA